MSRPARAARTLVITAGIAVGVLSLLAFRRADWPVYTVYVVLASVLFLPYVEVAPGLGLPLPGLALTIGFIYIAGLPIILLQNVAFVGTQFLHMTIPERWRASLGRGALPAVPWDSDMGTPADWATFALGLAARAGIMAILAPGGGLTTNPGAMVLAELGGLTIWALLSVLPIYSFRSPLATIRERDGQALRQDLALIVILALTPFVFLIVYAYEAHGLAAAAIWSFPALGLHFVLRRLNDRRVGLEEQNRRLAALNRELEHRERLSAIGKMSSVVSHQMLQQLGVIGLHADLIRHTDAGADPGAAVGEAQAHAAAIEDALGAVNRVLTDLLVFSRDLRLHLYEHPLARVLEECVEECRPAAAERGVALRLECPDGPAAVFDKLKVKQAVVNVIRNAIEVSPAGGEVVVRGSLRDGQAEIAVADRGPGVPVRDREAVFTPFFTTKPTGTGLGLAIAREFTEAHGGRIGVDGQPGAGATFVLRLPQAGPPTADGKTPP